MNDMKFDKTKTYRVLLHEDEEELVHADSYDVGGKGVVHFYKDTMRVASFFGGVKRVTELKV